MKQQICCLAVKQLSGDGVLSQVLAKQQVPGLQIWFVQMNASGPFGKLGNTFLRHSRHSCVNLLSKARVRRRPCYACIFSPCSDNCGCEKSVTELSAQPTRLSQ